MIDLAQADRTMRKTELPAGQYIVKHDDNTLLGINLTWAQAYKIVCESDFCAQMIRTN
jgi:hypothetical protein